MIFRIIDGIIYTKLKSTIQFKKKTKNIKISEETKGTF